MTKKPPATIAGIFLSQDEVLIKIAEERRIYESLIKPDLEATHKPKFVYGKKKPDWENPVEELEEALSVLKTKNPDRISVASFGPFESLDRANKRKYGQLVANQPQNLLSGMNLVDVITQYMGWSSPTDRERVFINTDVNCGAVAEFATRFVWKEYPFGELRRLTKDSPHASYLRSSSCLVYVIIGHGIGAAQTWGGFRVRDRFNPEMGHIPIKHREDDEVKKADCDYHDWCVEGFASDEAHAFRLSLMKGREEDAEKIRIDYIAQFIGAIHLMIAPNAVVVDGPYAGKKQDIFLEHVRHKFREQMGGEERFYPSWREIGDLGDYISSPLCEDACTRGAIFMATDAFYNGLRRETQR